MVYLMINDDEAGFAAVNTVPEVSDNVRVGVVIDRVVPANSPESSMNQRKLMEWAEKYDFPYSYGRAMTGAVVLGDDSTEFGWKIKAGDLVLGTTREVLYAEQVGAKGICLEQEELLDILLNMKKYDFSTLKDRENSVGSSSAHASDPEGKAISCVYIGGMGGFLSDLKDAADVVRGKKIEKGVRLVISPVSADVYCKAADAGYLNDFMEAGGIVLNQCASAAVQARIGENEIMVSSDIYAQPCYAGPKTSEIYLTSAKKAAEMSLTGIVGKEL